MEDFAPVMVTLIVFYFVAYVIRLNLESKLRNKLIEKELNADLIKNLNISPLPMQGPSSLKWGIVSTALGLGLFLRILLNRYISMELRPEFTIGLLLLLGGIALIVFYLIAKRLPQNRQD